MGVHLRSCIECTAFDTKNEIVQEALVKEQVTAYNCPRAVRPACFTQL